MGFFKDLNNDDVSVNDDIAVVADEEITLTLSDTDEAALADEQVSLDGDAEAVDESLLENLFDESRNSDDDVQIEEEYDLEPAAEKAPAREPASEDQVTVITKGTTINGSIVSDCSLNVMGTINGDIECIGKLSISGSVVGNSTASDVYVNAKRLDGNIDSDGTVKIGLGTVVVGDIKAGSAVVAGAVKGELDIKGPVIFDSTAIVKGNVKAKSVQMNNGAVLEGFCSLSYASVDIDEIFE